MTQYEMVLKRVMEGLTISEALKEMKITSSHFYKKLTLGQKKELRVARQLQSCYSAKRASGLTILNRDIIDGFDLLVLE